MRILIRQPFNAQKELLNEINFAEKLPNRIPTSYRVPNGYFQEERFQKLDINFISFSQSIDAKNKLTIATVTYSCEILNSVMIVFN